ncbi:TPA: hypothetical protein ACH3X2_006521 [Trebouxia sp. C0005]
MYLKILMFISNCNVKACVTMDPGSVAATAIGAAATTTATKGVDKMQERYGVRALEGARQKDDNIKDEIWHELAQVQYLCWEQESAAALQKQQLLQGRMHRLLQQQHDHELAAQEGGDLDQVFESARHGLKAGEPAAAFTCPLTMEVFRDPVMTPSGLSYERSALVEHLKKVGAFDPITREAMTASQDLLNQSESKAQMQIFPCLSTSSSPDQQAHIGCRDSGDSLWYPRQWCIKLLGLSQTYEYFYLYCSSSRA